MPAFDEVLFGFLAVVFLIGCGGRSPRYETVIIGVDMMNVNRRKLTLAHLVLVLVYAVSTFVAIPAPAEGSGTAVVLTGDVSGGFGLISRHATATANEGQSDFEDAGYTVSRDDTATVADAVAAIQGANVQAVYIFAHGDPQRTSGKKTQFNEGVEMSDGNWLDNTNFGGQTFPNVREVVIHGCGQDQQSWRDLFPNAEFSSWSGSVPSWTCYWWQWGATATPKPSFVVAARQVAPAMPNVHQSLWSHVSEEVAGRTACRFATPVDPAFEMEAGLAASFGELSFNVLGYEDGNPLNTVLLMSVSAADGQVVAWDTDPSISPDFEVRVSQTAMFQLLECPLQLFTFENNGIEINNSSVVPSATLFRGFAALIFGVTEACQSADGCTCDNAVIRSGACCNPGGGCVQVTPAECEEVAGAYLGDNTTCAECPEPIPTMSEWGLIVMSVLVLAGGTVVLIRRRAMIADAGR